MAPQKPTKKPSLFPVSPDDALRAFMQVDPKKVKAAEARERTKKTPRPTRAK